MEQNDGQRDNGERSGSDPWLTQDGDASTSRMWVPQAPAQAPARADEAEGQARQIPRSTLTQGHGRHAVPSSHRAPRRKHRRLWNVIGVIDEILLTVGVLCALYVVWQMWWTGVVSAQTQLAQEQSVSWTKPPAQSGTYKLAKPQQGDPPVETEPAYGDVVGQMYIPRFGRTWKRLIVQGVGLDQLARHGLGHYPNTVMPGGVGNASFAGHRSGYGEPLGNVPEFRKGDAIIVRTEQYWYVYTMESHEIVLPSEVDVVAPVPRYPERQATERYITLTTCTPRYTVATHRWIVHGKFKYWARVSDGIPQELLASQGSTGTSLIDRADPVARIPSLTTIILWLVVALIVVWLASAIAWGWPVLRHDHKVRKLGGHVSHSWSLYGLVYRLQPGVAVVRWVEMILIVLTLAAAFMQWACPWLVTNVPYLRTMSNYSSVIGMS